VVRALAIAPATDILPSRSTTVSDSTEPATVPASPKTRPPRLWNKNFLLLWQGQFVSAIGDVVYVLVLGVWIFPQLGSRGIREFFATPTEEEPEEKTDGAGPRDGGDT
jgi:hypothetical protein